MKFHISITFLSALLAISPAAGFAQSPGGSDIIEFICRDAGLGRFGVVSKKLRNSAKAAAATAGVGRLKIKVINVTDVERPTLQVSRADLNAGNIPVTVTASPLGLDFGDPTISVVSPNNQPCSVTRDFTIEIKKPNGEVATDVARVSSPGTYKRKN
ncbi:MAG: hypothetical protein RL417_821 [Pseudomonadota bacterium]|jgi:hypothetical protein